MYVSYSRGLCFFVFRWFVYYLRGITKVTGAVLLAGTNVVFEGYTTVFMLVILDMGGDF
jgi:hypothetical protein